MIDFEKQYPNLFKPISEEHQELFDVDIDIRLMGSSASAIACNADSPSRQLMRDGFRSQYVPINNPEPAIFVTGQEKELLEANFHKVLPANCEVYRTIDYKVNDIIIDTIIVYKHKGKAKFGMVKIAHYEKNDSTFGFTHTPTKVMENLDVGDIFPKDTKLTTTNSEVNGQLAMGRQLNVAFITTADNAEDPFEISESACKKFAFDLYENKSFSYGSKIKGMNGVEKTKLPKNLYGDDNEYKIIPDINERLREDGVIAALFELHTDNYLMKMHKKLLQRYDDTDEIYESKHGRGEVVDIRVYFNPRRPGNKGHSQVYEQIEKYYLALKSQRQGLLRAANEIEREYDNPEFENELHVEIVNSALIENPKTKPFWNRAPMDLWTINIVIKHTIIPTNGFKFATLHGSKGIATVKPDKDMPIDANGLRADMTIDANSIVHRMNIGNKYEGLFGANTAVVNKRVLDMIDNRPISSIPEQELWDIYRYITGYFKLFGTMQYDIMQRTIDKKDTKSMLKYLRYIASGRTLQYYLRMDNEKPVSLIAKDILSSEYRMKFGSFTFDTGEPDDVTVLPMAMDSLYILMLYKIGNTWLAVNSNRINPTGMPISASKPVKDRMSYSEVPVKFVSEPDGVYGITYCSPEYYAEVRDRTLAPKTAKHIYYQLLTHETPSNIDKILDRDEIPLGGDLPLNAFKAITKNFGEELVIKEVIDED